MLTLSHFSYINQGMKEVVMKYAPLHRVLAKAQMMRDTEAVELALKWVEETKPFDNFRYKELCLSQHDSQAQEKY